MPTLPIYTMRRYMRYSFDTVTMSCAEQMTGGSQSLDPIKTQTGEEVFQRVIDVKCKVDPLQAAEDCVDSTAFIGCSATTSPATGFTTPPLSTPLIPIYPTSTLSEAGVLFAFIDFVLN